MHIPQMSIISLYGVDEVVIYPTGHFEPAFGIFMEYYWFYERLDKLTPFAGSPLSKFDY